MADAEYCLVLAGGLASLLQLLVLPLLLAHHGHARVHSACAALWPWCFALLPLANAAAWLGLPDEAGDRRDAPRGLESVHPRARAVVWGGLVVMIALAKSARMAFS